DPPSLSLSVTLDGLDLFWFHFPGSRWNSGVPGLPPWPSELETPQEILPESQICREILREFGPRLQQLLPEARGLPVVSVLPALPPVPGEPNWLLCVVQNIFPPALEISWGSAGAAAPIPGPFEPAADGSFQRVARLSLLPRPGDVHACRVTARNCSIVEYWGEKKLGVFGEFF
ncbi:DMA protein, partial [Cettia cetti]|nr:DMA protein [Cettia cetti]